jgi:hypothetical protein
MLIIPTTWNRDERIVVQGQPRQKVSNTLPERTSQEWLHTSVISAVPEV